METVEGGIKNIACIETILDGFHGTAINRWNGHGKFARVVVGEDVKGDAHLLQVIFAPDALGAALAAVESGQQNGRKNADDGNNN